MVIARRGLEYIERLPKTYKQDVSMFSISDQCKKNTETRVNQRKKEVSPFQDPLNSIWKVLMVTVLTGRSTGKRNLSILKRKLIQGFSRECGCESHGLDPILGDGSSVEHVSSLKSDQACLV